MILKVESERFRNKPLNFRTFLDNDYIAEVDGLRVGWILSDGLLEGARTWWWTMTGPCCGHGRIANHGGSASLEDAREQFRRAFEQWLQWALSEEEPVRWFGSAYEAPQSTFLPKYP